MEYGRQVRLGFEILRDDTSVGWSLEWGYVMLWYCMILSTV